MDDGDCWFGAFQKGFGAMKGEIWGGDSSIWLRLWSVVIYRGRIGGGGGMKYGSLSRVDKRLLFKRDGFPMSDKHCCKSRSEDIHGIAHNFFFLWTSSSSIV